MGYIYTRYQDSGSFSITNDLSAINTFLSTFFWPLLRNISAAAVDHRTEQNQDQELAAKFSELPPQDILCQAEGRTGKCQKLAMVNTRMKSLGSSQNISRK